MEDRSRTGASAEQRTPDAEARLLEEIRSGDAAAGRQFVHEHYQAIYRYLLYLARQRDLADDLTQETFLQGWRYLHTFQRRGTLRGWLLRIARREFLRVLQRRQAEPGVEGLGELAVRDATAWLEGVELRQVIDRLPLEEREVVLLHYLEGYTSSQIAPIVGVPARTVRRRLEQAREHLRQELGEDDLAYLNEPFAPMRQWTWLPLDQMYAVETRLSQETARHHEAHCGGTTTEDIMERREFLRQAAAGAAALMLPEAEKEIVDSRLTQKVTCGFKATALSDLCEKLKRDTGTHLAAGPSVADEKVTLFCEKLPLREVMRQLSRPFGYTWLRSRSVPGAQSPVPGGPIPGTGRRAPGTEYRYELVQELRSQLLEEELRNRDRNAALLALDAQMQQYRPCLDMSFEALQQRWEQGGETAPLLSAMVHNGGWGGIQLYHHLSPRDRAALVAGEELTFRPDAPDADHRLPAEWSRPILQALSHRVDASGRLTPVNVEAAGRPTLLSELPGIRVTQVRLDLNRSELGQVSLVVMMVTTFNDGQGERLGFNLRELATSRSPSAVNPDNAAANRELRGQPPFDRMLTLDPRPSCTAHPAAGAGDPDERFDRVADLGSPRLLSADVWEALHRATGLPIVADYYTRLYLPNRMPVRHQSLFEALCTAGDALGVRWRKDGDFLVCRSATFFWDKRKEVPNRYLQRWAQDREARGGLTLESFLEMASMTDQQLDSTVVAEGIEHCWGLREWAWLGGAALEGRLQRQHARFLATLAPEQRRQALGARGLPFRELTPAQQQGVLRLQDEVREALEREEGTAPAIQAEAFAHARITARYIPAGWFVALIRTESAPERPGLGAVKLVEGRTAAEAMTAAHRLSPQSAPPPVRQLRDGYFRADLEFDRP